MSTTVKRILIGAIVLVVVFLIARPNLMEYVNSSTTKNDETSVVANPQQQILNVEATVVAPRKVDNKISITGTILANENVEITSEISGKIIGIHFLEGQRVKKGQLLVSLNDDELQAQVEKFKYSRKLYQDTEFRQRKLLEKEAISREEYEQALTIVNTNLADIKVVEAQLAKTKITAPFDGIIALRQISLGAYITPSDIITSLYNIDPAKVEFSIPAKYSSQVSVGKKIEFIVDGTDEVFTGSVYAVEPQIDIRTRTLTLRAISANPKSSLLPGQFAKIELILQTLDSAIMVPTESVIPELNGHKVFIMKNGKVNSIQVEVGIRTEREVQIVSGLNVSDTVLTSGTLQVRPGLPITVTIIKTTPWQD